MIRCPLYDTHAHLVYSQLANQLESVLDHAREHEVAQLNCVATDLETTRAAVEMARSFPHIHATAGWHPNDCHALTPQLWDEICTLAQLPEVVALGETGLDLYWKDCPLEIQQHWFAKHWELSRQLGKPVIIHLRDCEPEMLAALEQEYDRGGPLHGVMHSFSGSSQTAARCLELGLHISFAGMLTYKNAENLRLTAREIPSDRLLVETDAPFLAPMPHRGQKPNLPGWVRHTAQCLADCRNTSLESLARQTTENACRLFGVSWSQTDATD
ncbi:MAG: TatD family hydrolase [Planctomycetota bacterium]